MAFAPAVHTRTRPFSRTTPPTPLSTRATPPRAPSVEHARMVVRNQQTEDTPAVPVLGERKQSLSALTCDFLSSLGFHNLISACPCLPHSFPVTLASITPWFAVRGSSPSTPCSHLLAPSPSLARRVLADSPRSWYSVHSIAKRAATQDHEGPGASADTAGTCGTDDEELELASAPSALKPEP